MIPTTVSENDRMWTTMPSQADFPDPPRRADTVGGSCLSGGLDNVADDRRPDSWLRSSELGGGHIAHVR